MFSAIFVVPLIIFMVIVAPIWLVLHYRSKRNTSGSLSYDDQQQIEALSRKADSLNKRVQTLEKILDSESPNWRNHYE